jgi:major membrane immunogen (membrane-anchored lipoprotein)
MRTFFSTTVLVSLLILAGCKGSDVYRGNWKALDKNGNKWDIIFDATTFTVKNDKGLSEKYEYTQNSVKIESSVRSYGIKLKDGRAFRISFPLADNVTKGIISLETNEPLYTIGRTEYVDYNDLFKL